MSNFMDITKFYGYLEIIILRSIGSARHAKQKRADPRQAGHLVGITQAMVSRIDRGGSNLTAEQVVLIYKLRWTIESFFAWWKRHLKAYHLIARSPYGLLMQILAGLITYLLLAIYCHEEHGERVSIERVRELRNKIRNEAAEDAAAVGLGPPDIVELEFGAYATS